MVDSAAKNLRIICPLCVLANFPATKKCVVCWADLRKYEAVGTLEQTRLVSKFYRRRSREQLVRRSLISTVAILFIGWWIFSVFEFGLPETPTMPRFSSPVAHFSGADWTLPRKDFQNSGYTEANLQLRFPEEVSGDFIPDKTVWKFDTDRPLLSTAIVVGDRVFLASGDSRMLALDRVDGTLIWEFTTTGPIHSTPSFAKNHLYFGLLDGRVIALNSETGNLLWEYETANPVLGSILVKNGTAYVGSGDSNLYALDAMTGEELWTWQTSGWIISTPVLLEDDILAVTSMDGFVYFLDVNTGRKRLTYNSTLTIHGSPAALGNQIIFGNQRGYVFSVDGTKIEYPGERFWRTTRAYLWLYFKVLDQVEPQKGTQWIYSTRGQIYTSPAIANGSVYITATNVMAVRSTLALYYKILSTMETEQASNELNKIDATVPLTNTSQTPQKGGALISLDVKTGLLQWKTALSDDAPTSPIVAGDYVLVGNKNGVLEAFDAANGEFVWSFNTGGEIDSSVSVVGNELYLSSGDGALYKIQPGDSSWN